MRDSKKLIPDPGGKKGPVPGSATLTVPVFVRPKHFIYTGVAVSSSCMMLKLTKDSLGMELTLRIPYQCLPTSQSENSLFDIFEALPLKVYLNIQLFQSILMTTFYSSLYREVLLR
jgi:hypothetical protein